MNLRSAFAAALPLSSWGLPLWMNNQPFLDFSCNTNGSCYPWNIPVVCFHQVATIALDSQVPAGWTFDVQDLLLRLRSAVTFRPPAAAQPACHFHSLAETYNLWGHQQEEGGNSIRIPRKYRKDTVEMCLITNFTNEMRRQK